MKKIFLSALLLINTLLIYAQQAWEKDFTKPEATEINEPKPKIVRGSFNGAPPSDAIILFNGENMDNWVMKKDGSPSQWVLKNGVMTAKLGTGDIQSKQKFGNFQLHIEFKIPEDAPRSGDRNNSGNSGVFLQERYELQIFDSYQNETPLYANGQIGSIYKQVIPMANASSKPGEWNVFDVYYTQPQFRSNGSVETPAYVTLVHNGVLTLNHFEIQGSSKYIGIPYYEPHGKGAIRLQEHGSEVSFRNIWVREF